MSTPDPDPDASSKAVVGGCEWEVLPPCQNALDEYGAVDVAAIEHLETLMDLAEEGGLLPGQYEAPKGRWLLRLNPPWIGALYSDGPDDEHGHRQYRLYFGEAPTNRQALVAALLHFKRSEEPADKVRGQQTRRIGAAMDLIQRWCNKHGHKYRKLR